MKKLLIISEGNSDFTDMFSGFESVECRNPADFSVTDLDKYDSFAVPEACLNLNIKELLGSGKPVFIRTSPLTGASPDAELLSTRFKRLVTADDRLGLVTNNLLDDQDNVQLPASPGPDAIPHLIYGEHIMSHSVYKGETATLKKEDYGLWTEDNVLYCSFDISNFTRARFAPFRSWEKVMCFIGEFLMGTDAGIKFGAGYTNGFIKDESIGIKASFGRAAAWFTDAEIIINDGLDGVYEGFATEIKPDGTQKKAVEIRNDCCGEVMFTMYLDSLLNDNSKSAEISDNISDFIFSEMFTDESGGLLDGMMKWSLGSPHICYQDDVARAVIPQMLKCRYSGSNRYMDECNRALEFLYKTTGTDGLRRNRTENQDLSPESVERLASIPAENPSAHYTGYYSGALLLNYTLTGNEKFRDMGVTGLESIMKAYPETMRCQSETQEYARLILPLSLMYEATGEQEHLDMLYRVTDDLKRFRHESGTYLEWDTGYKSRYSRTTGDECSILTENGDPVSDLLYTANWLPFNFITAYFVTKDSKFLALWEDISGFMANAQIISGNKSINGAWARGWDTGLNEVFALPNDVGWGPWCIESGWTVAEIASGMAMGLMREMLLKFY